MTLWRRPVAVGRYPEVRNWGLLESALARPRASVFGEEAYPGLTGKAAALLHSLATNHALVDGNKRLGLVAVLLFYGMNGYDLARALRKLPATGGAVLIAVTGYAQERDREQALAAGFDELFANFDAIVTPAARGTAPPLDSTGDPAFGTLWTLTGMPALCLPLMHGSDGLPLGVQLVGRRHDDARLLRTARWMQTLALAT